MSPTKITDSNGTMGIAPTGRQSYNIALIPGDGIGIEVIHEGKVVLQKLAQELDTFDLQFQDFEWSSAYYKKHGKYLPEDALEQVKKFNAILFGAVGAPGMSALYLRNRTWTNKNNRCTGSYFTLGITTGIMSTPPAVRQCSTYSYSARNYLSTSRL
jgi:isocitrate dehydrogenase